MGRKKFGKGLARLLGRQVAKGLGVKARKPKRGRGPRLTPVRRAAEPIVVPEGPCEGWIYAYDGRPLKGTRKGSKFRLDVMPGDVHMTSVYTGTSTRTYELDVTDKLVARDGYAVGYIAGNGALNVSSLVREHGCVSIVVRREGTDEGGWPLLKTLLPEGKWFRDKRNELDNA